MAFCQAKQLIMDMDFTTVLIILGALAAVAFLYTFFYRERSTGGTDDRNWVNDSNYNISTSPAESEAISGATAAESANIIATNKTEGPYPPSEGEFHDLRENLDVEGVTSNELKAKLSSPS